MEGNTLETALGLVYSVLPIYSDYNNNNNNIQYSFTFYINQNSK
jgi:hypothetical protein